jgi:hypothetical protein
VIVDEVLKILAPICVDAPHRLADRAVVGAHGLDVDLLGADLRAVIERRADNSAPLFLRQCHVWLGQGRTFDLAAHQQIEAIA